jgi:hypothetical protein
MPVGAWIQITVFQSLLPKVTVLGSKGRDVSGPVVGVGALAAEFGIIGIR